ncbi:UDP-N-acetylglucosamine 2-epimerase [Leptospira weilii]|nr:UDP-N-acetylglucosamine 2-epimerase [Leptospira weilii]
MFDLQLLVGGTHLLDEFGLTINQIKKDGFQIDHIFDFICKENVADSVIKSLSKLQEQSGIYLIKNKPDLIIVLGDRFELLSFRHSLHGI